jgi:hypothetical protein
MEASIQYCLSREGGVTMKSKERVSSAWLIEAPDYIRTELHGFEVDMSGRTVVPEFRPCAPDALSSVIAFESELRAATDIAA